MPPHQNYEERSVSGRSTPQPRDTSFSAPYPPPMSAPSAQLPLPPRMAQLPASSRSSMSTTFAPTSQPSTTRSSSAYGETGGPSGPSQSSFYSKQSAASSKASLARSFNSPSSSSIWYHMQKPPMEDEMPLGVNADPEAVKEFLALAEKRAPTFKSNAVHSTAFQVGWFVLILCIIYFGFIGFPLWDGIVLSIWKYISTATNLQFGFLIFFLWGTGLAWLPLLFVKFEKNIDESDSEKAGPRSDASETCLLIPAYKAAAMLPETIEHALKIFKPNQIFICANGNSPTPLDDTEDVCKRYGVNHAWIPFGSKITAEFVGVMLAKKFKYAMLIDDDVHLPPNLPIVTDRISKNRTKGATMCVGYTIKSTGANGAKGTLIQQAQDIEYKLSGLSRHFQGTYGSAVFPHGAIILWDRDVLEKLFWGHPGYQISEDWYFGHTCRSAGFRIQFTTQMFVPTETPPSLFIPVKSTRGGYGEMTVWKQRFYRWNFFFLYRLRDDINYLLFAWRLGRYELITKLFVFAEVYETFIFLSRPFMLPIALIVQPKMVGIMTAALMAAYIIGIIFFNAVHLRRKKEMVAWRVVPVYFVMKIALTFVNTLSVYYSLYAYAGFFSRRHPRVTENYPALVAAKKCLDAEFLKESNSHAEMTGRNEDEVYLMGNQPLPAMTR